MYSMLLITHESMQRCRYGNLHNQSNSITGGKDIWCFKTSGFRHNIHLDQSIFNNNDKSRGRRHNNKCINQYCTSLTTYYNHSRPTQLQTEHIWFLFYQGMVNHQVAAHTVFHLYLSNWLQCAHEGSTEDKLLFCRVIFSEHYVYNLAC